MKKIDFSIIIIFLFIGVFLKTFSLLEDSLNPEDIAYMQKKETVKFAYIQRSSSGKSYSDVYNEEIIKTFSRKTGMKTVVIRGNLDKIKNTKDIDIIIDQPQPTNIYSETPSISALQYTFYKLKDGKEEEGELLKNKRIGVLQNDCSPVSRLQKIANHIEFVSVENIEDGFFLLREKKIDLFFSLRDDMYMRLPEQKIFERVSLDKNSYLEKKFSVKSGNGNLKRITNAFIKTYNHLEKKEDSEKSSSKLLWNLIAISPEEKRYLMEKSSIKIGGFFKGFAPIMYFDSSKKLNGAVLEYINMFKYGAGINISIVPQFIDKHKSLEEYGKELNIDLFVVASRELMHEKLVLTSPYYYYTLGIFGLEQAGDNFFRDLDELSEKKIGVIHQKSFLPTLGVDTDFKIESAENLDELYKMLKSRKIDYFLYDYNLMSNSRNKKGMSNLKLYGILDKDFSLSFATFKEDIILRNIMDKILKFTDTEEIFSKWGFRSQEDPKETPYRQWMIIFGIVLLVLVPYLMILRNEIGKRKKAEIKLLETKRELENALNIKTAFLANVSHELKTPLTAVMGFTKLLLKRENDQKKRQLLENIQVAGDTLVTFIDNILDLSKLEAGKVELKYIRINLRNMINNIERICNGLNKGRSVFFIMNVTENVPKYFMGDEVRLTEVILNLVNNSFKFTKSGKVEVKFDSYDDKLFITITDTGMGIPEDKINSIFERYHQLDLNENIEKKGFGLGLTIVKEIVDMMEGEIEVESEYKEWTTFKIAIPITKKLQLVGSIRGKSN
ncbi:ATP-binding protein [uncultured Ilyobacter sp.]|uniref:ATP-binding protein n=1 Tax=uncultured Ilyobacter sp. TaxID=544433 RepID=UPI0029C99B02|nr:ATP-binding protein [uncultured Ilyobacter sp.]